MGKVIKRFSEPITYATWSKDETVRFSSTSGGAFSEFAKGVLAEGGVVAGARYNKQNMVEHCIIENVDELWKIRQSKYISSLPKDIYLNVKQYLELGKKVGFCGSPCQVAGLYSYLGYEPDNLITMDFICRGMNSPKALKAWITEMEKKEKSKVTRIWFKYKDGGWKSSPRRVRLDFDDGHYAIIEGQKNLFMNGYLTSNLYIRPCCGRCGFKGYPRKSDITFADYWGVDSKLDDDKGTSLVLLNSEKGKQLFDSISVNMEYYKMEFTSILGGNPMFEKSVVLPKERALFLKDLDNLSFSKALQKYSIKKPLIRRIKNGIAKRVKRK